MYSLKVMTFNIHHGVGTDRKLHLERIACVIKESGADIIGLNEVDRRFSKRSDFLDEIMFLSDLLKFDFAFSPSLTLKNRFSKSAGQYGNGLLSRFTLENVVPHQMDFLSGIIEGRSLLQAGIKPKQDKMIHLFVTHLSINPLLQKKQLDFIKKHLKGLEPVLLLGDFNMKTSPGSTLQLTDLSTGCKTYPSRQPRAQLDYIFGTKSIEVIESSVPRNRTDASDHLPIISTVQLIGY